LKKNVYVLEFQSIFLGLYLGLIIISVVTAVVILKDQTITLTDLAELNLKKDKIFKQEVSLLRDFDSLMNQGETVSSELLLKLSSIHTRLIHVLKWIYSD